MACAVDESARKFAVAPRDVEDAVPYNARPAALAGSPLSACPVPFYPVRDKNRTGSFGRAGPVFMAIPHNSTRAFGERFFAETRFEKCRNTLCTRKGHAASVRRQGRQRLRNISNFSNRRIGEKYPAKAEEELCGVALYHGASSSPPVDSVGASVGGSVGSGSVGFSVGLSVGLSVGSVGASVGGSVSSTSLATRRLRQS